MALSSGNKVENNGSTAQGKLFADEFNELVRQSNDNLDDIERLDKTTVKKVKVNDKTLTPDSTGTVEVNITVPTKLSELQNDTDFLTEHQDLSGFATEQWVKAQGYFASTRNFTLLVLRRVCSEMRYTTQRLEIC